ncbi:ATP-binding protein [Streptomyces sp. PU-14G]|uniref:ATP-binding protein n=1 Tax=Streptomyces sp. PU-14G TaxID=2800808 RepID=UPI0034DE4FFE
MLSVRSDEATVADARDLAGAFVAGHSGHVDRTAVETVVSELVTNAVRHTAGWWSLTLSLRNGVLTAAVHDTSRTPPAVREGALDGSGGWGLHLVRRLAGAVETRIEPEGKTVTARWPALAPQAR